MAGEEQFERTEPATPRQREKFREKGQVAKSREVATVVSLLAAITYFYFNGESILETMKLFWIANFKMATEGDLSLERMMAVISANADIYIGLTVPFFGILFVLAIGANVAQVGWLFTSKPLEPDLNKVNPISNFKEKFLSIKIVIDTVLNILKISVLIAAVYMVIIDEMDFLPSLTQMTPYQIVVWIMTTVLKIMLVCVLLFVIVAIADMVYQWFMMEKKMRMTKQEVKDEFKDSEGDPHLKGHMRARAREISMNKIIDTVPEADVIITNPTHLAIALRYKQGKDSAPVVLAKGKGFWAERIKEIAREHKIEIIEDKLLARAMYKASKVGKQIPAHLYRAVAELLAYVYSLKVGAARRRWEDVRTVKVKPTASV